MFVVQVEELRQLTKKEAPENLPVAREFKDIFPEEIPHLPPEKEIGFSIKILPWATPISRAPYRMSTSKLLELILQLQ